MLRSILTSKGSQSVGLAILVFGTSFSSHTDAAPTFAGGVNAGMVAIPQLDECSGLVASRNNVGVLWAHNDSGDDARIFALSTQGLFLGIYELTNGGTHVDYEDIAIGPGPIPNVAYLYVGDIGDNNADRKNIRVYQIPEPAVYARQQAAPPTRDLKGVRRIILTYPDGARNAEALFMDPVNGDLFIVTKETTTSHIYTATQAALNSGNKVELTHVRSIAFDVPSAADMSVTGREIIIRQEDFARLWTRTNGQSVSAALAATPVTVPVIGRPVESNGEAIAFDAEGNGYFTLSEASAATPLYYFARTSSDGARPTQALVAAGTAWKFLDAGGDQGTAWRQPDFNDATWSTGEAQFGYGDGDEQTVVSYGGNANNKRLTTYFRKQFVVNQAACLEAVMLKLLVDDGAAVFLNGTEIARYQLAANAGFNTPASASQPDSLEDTWLSFPVAPGRLVQGTNILAVEVHQAGAVDPDLSFDLQLTAKESGAIHFVDWAVLNGVATLTLCGPSGATVMLQTSTNLAGWSNLGSVQLVNGSATFITPPLSGPSPRFFRAAQ
ncbi:MAG TPA: hypothetical protein PKN95_10365 [Verrucomicrobiota bacterium]|nr:hypothetical protein [Verrucomicrobiota bacterium]HNT15510.1 hypothetical protein [Verrucomicrobiota bacterium]